MLIHLIFWCIWNYYDFTPPSIQSVARSATVWLCVLKRDFLRSLILGSVSRLGITPIESPPTTSQYLSIQSFALSAAVWPQFHCQVMAPQFDPHFWGMFGWTYWSKIVPIKISSKHSCSTSVHAIGLSCTVWPQYTMRQTDRAIRIGRLCYRLLIRRLHVSSIPPMTSFFSVCGPSIVWQMLKQIQPSITPPKLNKVITTRPYLFTHLGL